MTTSGADGVCAEVVDADEASGSTAPLPDGWFVVVGAGEQAASSANTAHVIVPTRARRLTDQLQIHTLETSGAASEGPTGQRG